MEKPESKVKDQTVLILECDGRAHFERIDLDLSAMQGIVGGYVERTPVVNELASSVDGGEWLDMWVNEEGLLMELEANVPAMVLSEAFVRWNQPIVGRAFVCRHDDEGDSVGLTEADVSAMRKWIGENFPGFEFAN